MTMNWNIMKVIVILWLCVAGQVYSTPTITTYDKVSTVSEATTTNTELSIIQCSDPDGDPTRTYVQNVVPSSPCTNCFEVLDCLPNECLYFRSGVGALSATSAPIYLVTVACDDSKETPVTEIIQINVVAGNAPQFVPDTFAATYIIPNARNVVAGADIYKVDAKDDDVGDDVIYTLKVSPSEHSDKFTIEKTSGQIKAVEELSTLCASSLTFEVTISDGEHTVGPQVIAVKLNNPNDAPSAVNLDREVQIPEDATGNVHIIEYLDPSTDWGAMTYTYSSTNTDGLAQYTLDGTSMNVDLAGALDYEASTLRETNVRIQLSDSKCQSQEYFLKLVVTDVNEEPIITPLRSTIEVCEGEREFDTQLTVTDPDNADTQTWSIHTSTDNRNGYFSIIPTTGWLKTNLDYDVDTNRDLPSVSATKSFVLQVEDKGGLTATATLTVSFLDCNDNAPVFQQPAYTFSASECAASGAIVGTLVASDADSARENNNVFTFSGSSGAVRSDTGGQLTIQTALPAGSVTTFNVYATDQGETPGPLTSENPAVVSIYFTECPTTAPPATAAPATAAATTAAPTAAPTLAPNSTSLLDVSLGWIVIAAILGAVFLATLAYMCWRYGALMRCPSCSLPKCGNPCKGRCRTRPKEPRRPPRRDPIRKPESPEEPAPIEDPGPGFIFGFWKERYPNDDFRRQPNRRAQPEPGNMNKVNTNTVDDIEYGPPDQGGSGGGEVAAKAGRCSNCKGCTIL